MGAPSESNGFWVHKEESVAAPDGGPFQRVRT
jgi:hypothetical protein